MPPEQAGIHVDPQLGPKPNFLSSLLDKRLESRKFPGKNGADVPMNGDFGVSGQLGCSGSAASSSPTTNSEGLSPSVTDSPSFLPSHLSLGKGKSRPAKIAVKLKKSLSEIQTFGLQFGPEAAELDSPTTTLAADLSQNFHIQHNQHHTESVPSYRRSLFHRSSTESALKRWGSEKKTRMCGPISNSDRDLELSPLPHKRPSAMGGPDEQFVSMKAKNAPAVTTRSASNTLPAVPTLSSFSSSNSLFSNSSSASSASSASSISSASSSRQNSTTASSHLELPFAFKPSSNLFSTEDATRGTGSCLFPSSDIPSDAGTGMGHRRSATISTGNSLFSHPRSLSTLQQIKESGSPQNPADVYQFCVPSPIPETRIGSMDTSDGSIDPVTDSPLQAAAAAKSSSRLMGPRTKFRRTHSMFEKPEEVVEEEKESVQAMSPYAGSYGGPFAGLMKSPMMPTVDSLLDDEKCPIPTFKVESDPLRRIKRDTLCDILDNKYKQNFDRHLIVDCRFEYEFQGGHIAGAINVSSQEQLTDKLLKEVDKERKPNERLLVIFHCELSSHRGPLMALHLRKCDRSLNSSRYPYLHYPDIVVLEGGYKHFFERYASRCYPQKYIEMDSKDHTLQCEKRMNEFRKAFKLSGRSQSISLGGPLQQYSKSNNNIRSNFANRIKSSSNLGTERGGGTLNFSRKLTRTMSLQNNSQSPKKSFSSFDLSGKENNGSMLDLSFKFPAKSITTQLSKDAEAKFFPTLQDLNAANDKSKSHNIDSAL